MCGKAAQRNREALPEEVPERMGTGPAIRRLCLYCLLLVWIAATLPESAVPVSCSKAVLTIAFCPLLPGLACEVQSAVTGKPMPVRAEIDNCTLAAAFY